jgi:hypothetical protein
MGGRAGAPARAPRLIAGVIVARVSDVSVATLQPAALGAAAPRAAEKPWMIAPGLDLVLFLGVTLLTIVPWVVADVLHYPGWYVILGVGIANGPLLISTWTRVYLVSGERFKYPMRYWVIPGLALAFAIVADAEGGMWQRLIRSTIFYWATWHFVAQSWGVLRIYQRKHGAALRTEARLEKALIFLPAFWCALHRLFTGPWTLFNVEVIHANPPALLVNGLGALIVAIAAVYLLVFVQRSRDRAAHEWIRPAYLVLNFFGFAMPFLVIRDGDAAFAAAALWHAVQYIAIVWLFNARRYARGIDPQARLMSWVSQRGRALAYMGLIGACAAVVYMVAFGASFFVRRPFEEIALTFWTGFTLGHYYLDGSIWKSRKYDLRTLTTHNPAPSSA